AACPPATGSTTARPGEDLEEVEAAVGRGVLVLPASGDPQVLTFDRVARPSQLVGGERTAGEGGERAGHRGHHRRGAAETASRRRVAAHLPTHPPGDAHPRAGRL